MLKRVVTFGIILLVVGCADPIPGAKNILETGLPKKAMVEYRDVQRFPGDVICGQISIAESWGDGGGYRRFIVRDDQANKAPSDDEWAVLCNENPAIAFQARFGIGSPGSDNSNLQTVQRQLEAMDTALQQYLIANQAFPSAMQQLLPGSTTSPAQKNVKEGGYIQEVPVDPWGRPYIYERARQLHPAPKTYKLYTLGRDGVAGGTGDDADIGNWHLFYLEHISSL